MKLLFFKTPAHLRKWFEKYHAKKTEVWLGFHKIGTGKPGITWSQSVDQALCFGWIDGIRKSFNESSYMIRFTPRKRRSIWSAVNIKKIEELTKNGLMQPEGIAAFEKRDEARSKIYSFEQKNIQFDKPSEKIFKANKNAWKYFTSQAPSYQKTATWWVISAKQEETKRKRLNILLEDSEKEQHIKLLRRTGQ